MGITGIMPHMWGQVIPRTLDPAMRRPPALVLLVLSLMACMTPVVQTDVTRFHALPQVGAGRSFTIAPEGPQAGSLEFERYADLVADQLVRHGWRAVPPSRSAADRAADTVVKLSWGTGEPRVEAWQSPSSIYGGMGWGAGRRGYGAGIGLPLGDPFPYWETRSATYFPKWVAVEILDAEANRAGLRRVLFEGRAVAEGSQREIAPVMPSLIEALFTGFPGASGRTVRINVPRGG